MCDEIAKNVVKQAFHISPFIFLGEFNLHGNLLQIESQVGRQD